MKNQQKVAESIPDGPQMGGAASPVGMQGDGGLGDAQVFAVRFHDHFCGELHAGTGEIKA